MSIAGSVRDGGVPGRLLLGGIVVWHSESGSYYVWGHGGRVKRRRYSVGATPSARRNARRIVSAVPNPHDAATGSIGCAESSSSRRAASSRTRVDVARGRVPVSGGRASEVAGSHGRSLGQRGHRESPATCSHHSADVARPVAIGHLGGEGRAELRLAARPSQEHHEMSARSAAPRRGRDPPRPCASARSMPAVTPADVQTAPSAG